MTFQRKCLLSRSKHFHTILLVIAAILVAPSYGLCGNVLPDETATSTVNVKQSRVITRDEAVQLALKQASSFTQSQLDEQIAAEDARQSQNAMLPGISHSTTFNYNSPSANDPEAAREHSFLAPSAIREHTSLVTLSGTVDISGNLHATYRRNRAALRAARAGTEASRRLLIQTVDQEYYSLSLAEASRDAAEKDLASALEFEKVTGMLFDGGEVPEVDVVRARLETAARRDALEQARANETVAAYGLKILVGYDADTEISTTGLTQEMPGATDSVSFPPASGIAWPEIRQIDNQLAAAGYDVKISRSESLPQLTYSLGGGYDTDSLSSRILHSHSGYVATIGLEFPIVDWGAGKSRVKQSRMRMTQIAMKRDLSLKDLQLQYNSARTQAETALKRIVILRAALDDADKNLDTTMARYRAGECSIIEVFEARNSLTSQRTALYKALSDYRIGISIMRNAQEYAHE